ncbi:MAG TPA: aminotransferase class V-fold PLP-dependent enzyme, partial [Polyangia bacterium]|nr:aminotransferase class V-fold PLP-dependent enzyme [Polyangia bacterium]
MTSKYKSDFPLLAQEVDGMPITYLDSASTTPKPRTVIDAVMRYYTQMGANVHRGVHPLSEATTQAYERARLAVAQLIGASPHEIVFTRNATESFNLVAQGLGLGHEDEVVFPASEHHSNYMPWRLKAKTVLIDIDDEAVPRYQQLKERLTKQTKLVTVAHVSNVTGVVAPVEEWIATAHAAGVPVMVDASQSVSHLPIDVKKLDCDFMAFSSHKIFGPSGVGVLYVRKDRFEHLQLWNVGGGMVNYHGEDRYEVREAPFRYEAGTPNIEGAIGFGAAIDYVRAAKLEEIAKHSRALGAQLVEGLRALPGAKVLGAGVSPEKRVALCTVSVPVPS